MRWFWRDPVAAQTVNVSAAGLVKLVDDLTDACMGFGMLERGMQLNVYGSLWNKDRYIVALTSYQTEVLRKQLPDRTLTTEYGEA